MRTLNFIILCILFVSSYSSYSEEQASSAADTKSVCGPESNANGDARLTRAQIEARQKRARAAAASALGNGQGTQQRSP